MKKLVAIFVTMLGITTLTGCYGNMYVASPGEVLHAFQSSPYPRQTWRQPRVESTYRYSASAGDVNGRKFVHKSESFRETVRYEDYGYRRGEYHRKGDPRKHFEEHRNEH